MQTTLRNVYRGSGLMAWGLEFDGDGLDGNVPVRGPAPRDRRFIRLCFDSWRGHTLFGLRLHLEDWWIELHMYRRRAALVASASRIAAADV